ncbi:hypothetical protein BH23ACT2_BH23ACT2_14300 [soil metagenome]
MSPPTAREVLDRRRAEQDRLLATAERFAEGLDPGLGVRVVVVFGSVARGDFHDASDIDVLVVAEDLPPRPPERNATVGIAPPRVEFVAWTPDEWRKERKRGNPIALEAAEHGHLLRGTLEPLG